MNLRWLAMRLSFGTNMMRLCQIISHPSQYQAPLLRYLVAAGMDIQALYATDITARGYVDAGFGVKVAWDRALLGGYEHKVLFPDSPSPTKWKGYFRYLSEISRALDENRPDAVWIHGWGDSYCLAALRAAHDKRIPIHLSGETFKDSLLGGWFHRLVHRMVMSAIFRRVDSFLAIGSANRDFYLQHGVPREKIHLVPYAVDNAFFQNRCAEARPRRELLRAELGIPSGTPIILYCAKFVPVKNPASLIEAFGRVLQDCGEVRPCLLMVGDGALRTEMQALAEKVAPGQVKFLGFRNQTELPALYDLCDLFVLPSVFEPWGLVVNEAMNAGKPVIASHVTGSTHDLIRRGVNGEVFQAGDALQLAGLLKKWVFNPQLLASGGEESLRIINQWSFQQDLEGLRSALKLG